MLDCRAGADAWEKEVLKRADSVLAFRSLSVEAPLAEIYERAVGVSPD